MNPPKPDPHDFSEGGCVHAAFRIFVLLNGEAQTVTGSCSETSDGLRIESDVRAFDDFQAVHWTHTLTHSGDCDSALISGLCDCDVLLPLDEEEGRNGYLPGKNAARVVSMKGMVEGSDYTYDPVSSASEYQFMENLFCRKGTQVYQNIGGRPSDGLLPFFDVNAGNHGYLVVIGWTGGWKAEFIREEGGIRVRTGLKKTAFRLHPNESIRTSSVLIMAYNNGQTEARNRLRRLIRTHFSLIGQEGRPSYGPMAYESWGGMGTEEICRRIAALREHGIRFEYHWVDAGWYGMSTPLCTSAYEPGWSTNTGDWRISPQVHPNGMREIVEENDRSGLQMMLWVEPERCIASTPDCQAHPDRYLDLPFADKGNQNRSLLLDLGNEEAWQAAFDTLSSLIERLKVGCYRQDFNCDPMPYWENADEQDRIGLHEIRHVMGLYRLWDALLTRYPHLIIDNCSSGGRRIDLESLRRSIPFFRSDYQCGFNTEPDVTQVHGTGISNYIPFNGCTTKVQGDLYAARSTYSSAWGGAYWCTKWLEMDDEKFAVAKKVSDEYLQVRPYFCEDFYNHGSTVLDDAAWCIWQYDRPSQEDGIVLAFRRKNSPSPVSEIMLCALDKNANYRFMDFDSGESCILSGEAVSREGLLVRIPEKRDSRIIRYEKIR